MIQDPQNLTQDLLSLIPNVVSEMPPVSVSETEEKETSLMKFKLLSKEGSEEEEKYGLSTELTLFTDPWNIKKKLTISDRSHQNRLLLNARTVDSHLVRYLPESCQNMVQGWGLTFDVYDHDTGSTHQILLTKQTNRGSYVLSGGWYKDFVIRRVLKKKDEIGMYWDRSDSKLHFCVLSRAPTGVSSGSVLAVPSQAPTGVGSGSVTIASYSPLLADP